jgi:hypothetical protein
VVVLSIAWRAKPSDATGLRFLAALALTAAAVWLIAAVLGVALPLLGEEPLRLSLQPGWDEQGRETAAGITSVMPETIAVAVEASALSGDAVVLLIAGSTLAALVAATVAGALAFGLRRIAAGDPFHHSMYRATLLAGLTLSIGMTIATGVEGFGLMMAADELNTLLASESFAIGFQLDFAPLFIGLAILGLAAVFRAGERLQRETAGLV